MLDTDKDATITDKESQDSTEMDIMQFQGTASLK